MDQIIGFFKKLFDSSDWPPRWHCGRWTEFHGWLYIISDLLIWSAYFAIPVIIIRYISRRQDARFLRIYFLFAAFILACGATHFLDAAAFWIPAYRLNALVRLITGILSWVTVFSLIKLLPAAFSLKSQNQLETEITQRKKAEEQIQKQKQEIQDFIDSMSTLSAKIDTKGNLLMINKTALQATGLAMEKLPETNFLEGDWWALNPSAHARVCEAFEKACNGENINYDENITVFGQMLTINFSLIPILTADGRVDYIVAEGRDITLQKRAEEKIKESEHMFSTLFYKSPVMKSIAEISTGKYIAVNNAFAAFFDRPKEKIIGKISSDLNMLVFPEERDKIIKNIRENGFVRDVETQIRSDDGKTRWVSTSIDIVNLNGEDCFLTAATDITKRKEAEESLAKLNNELEQKVKERTEEIYNNEKRFRALIENSHEVIIISDAKGNHLFVSEGIKRMLGYTPEEFMGLSIFNMVADDEADALRLLLQKIIDAPHQHQPFTATIHILHKNGSWRWVETVMAGFLDVPGLNGIVINYHDVTERKEAEENMKATLKEISDYKYALDESSIVAITDQKGVITHANNNFCKISKYKREELIGQDHRIINSGYHSKEFIRNLWITIANGKIWKGELKNRAKDGTIYWVDTTIVPFLNKAGKPYQYVAIRADITERKQAEENLQKSLKEISDYKYALDESSIVAITDQQGIIKHANHNFCKISKYGIDELIGQDHRIINSGYHPKTFIRNLWVTIANGKIWRGELKNKAKDGTIYWVDTTIVPFLNEVGKPYQYVAIRADITDRKKAENEIQKLNEELEQKVIARTAELQSANKEMEAFSYSVSHDLRAPLRGIIGFTAILEEDYVSKLDDEAKRVTTIIKNNAMRMGQLIDDLLTFSRMGRQDIIKTNINTSDMVNEVIDGLSINNNRGHLNWIIGDLPVVKGDVNTIRQVWVNLISNAIKYSTNEKQPQIEIVSFSHEGQTAFFVKDNGVGFDKKYMDKLFKVFQRLHSSEEFEGTGVGLAIIEKIISKHGGKVWAEAEINRGASFYFSLPA